MKNRYARIICRVHVINDQHHWTVSGRGSHGFEKRVRNP